MSNPGDKQSQEPASQEHREPAADSQSDPRSGRTAYDERGNSVWEWQLETGVYSRDISTQRLKKLDLNDLSIADTAIQRRPPDLGGFNPYDNSSSARGNVGKNDPYNGGNRAPLNPAAEPKRKPSDPKKLQEWMELGKRVEQNKREDE
jgi:hypothetical protein